MREFWYRRYGRVDMVGYIVPHDEPPKAIELAERDGWHLSRVEQAENGRRLTFWRPVKKDGLLKRIIRRFK